LKKDPHPRIFQAVKTSGLVIFMAALLFFSVSVFIGSFTLDEQAVRKWSAARGIDSTATDALTADLSGRPFRFPAQLVDAAKESVAILGQRGLQVDFPSDSDYFFLAKRAGQGFPAKHRGWFFFLTFGLSCLGALMFFLPDLLPKSTGTRNYHTFHRPEMNRGWMGWLAFGWLVSFYLMLYFKPVYIVNMTYAADPVKEVLSGKTSDQWFLYGLLYTTVMLMMGIRMLIKYRGQRYQLFRTLSVVSFQVLFAFLLVEWLPLFQVPAADLKNIWPLDYSFFFEWRISELLASGKAGTFLFVWGMGLTIVAVPVLTYFYGKRWYCSWVCGCGGLAETLGDPYRHLSDKRLIAWKAERWLVHGVLVFAVLMTILTAWHTYYTVISTGPRSLSGVLVDLNAMRIREWYGLLIGSWFAGVIGTGFYPIFGNRVWCRFGCPLAAYLGLVQRFKSRFRITTNGGQCISCGNCSTYCEMGIDVRWYAQRGQNIVRSSCVGCGVCASVCPRGVLKLENGPEEGRINDNPILIGRDGARLNL
jgi:ferredoxin-type protein NapH